MSATWRQTKQGEWVVMAPAAELSVGATVTVTAKSGKTKTVTVIRVGRPFTAQGREMAYGYLAESASHSHSTSGSHRTSGASCDECGRGGARYHRNDSSGIGGTVCGRCNQMADYELSFC